MSNQLNLLRRGSSEVINGNMLTLPVAGGILYVQPVYVQSSGDAKYPRLQRVLVSFGDKVGFAPSLEEALNQVFGGSSGAKIDKPTGSNASQPADSSSKAGESKGADATNGSLKQALSDAAKAMQDSDAAMKKGDWAAYGEAQKRLNDALQKAVEIEGKQSSQGGSGASSSPSATPAASASAARPSASASASASRQ